MLKTFRRVRKFQIRRGADLYRQLDALCLKSRNMYNATLFILRQLNFASFPRNGHTPDYYLSRIDPEIRKYVETTTKTVKSKKDGTEKTVTYHSLVVHSASNPNGKFTDEKALYTIFLRINQPDYKAVQNSAARNAVKLAVKAMKAYQKSLVDYLKNRGKYKGEPKLPGFRKDKARIPFVIDSFKTNKDGSLTVNGDTRLTSVYFNVPNAKVKQIRVVPKPTIEAFDVEIVYEKSVDVAPAGQGVMGIDIGINNVCTLATSNGEALIVNGKPLKNINQFYNKLKAELMTRYAASAHAGTAPNRIRYSGHKMRVIERKRTNKIGTFIHQLSRYIVDYARANGIGKIVIGHNDGWKNECDIGKRNNQTFVQIPFNDIIQRILYKAEEFGIEVVEVNEHHTSKCSALENEEICRHENYKGKRGGKHNKEFITGDGTLVNADVNGALNILRLGTGQNIEAVKTSVLTPPKFNKVGFRKYRMQLQNGLSSEKPYGAEVAVDVHSAGKLVLKKSISIPKFHQTLLDMGI